MGLSESIVFAAATDVGRVRDHNEDNFLVDRRLALFIVADGMGGHAAGEVASGLAVRLIHAEVKRSRQIVEAHAQNGSSRQSTIEVLQLLERAVQVACAKIHEEAKSDTGKRGMGTTLSALLVCGSHGFIAHVGDSRIYMLREGRIQQVTEDHTVFNELLKRGKLSREQIEKVAQKNAITRAVGVYERVEVDTLFLEVLPGDKFLLASDGLHGYVAHTAELEPYLEDDDADQATRSLVELANKKGGKDNITALIVRLGEGDARDGQRALRLALKREVLSRVPLFSRLLERELLRVMQVAEVSEYQPGQFVVREGDRGDELFIVLTGRVKISRNDAVLNQFGPGEQFGEMALLRSMPRSATVVAVEPSELIVLHRRDFFEIIRKEHELAVKLLWQFLGVLAERLDQTSRDLSNARVELAAEDLTAEADTYIGLEEEPGTTLAEAPPLSGRAEPSPSDGPAAPPAAAEAGPAGDAPGPAPAAPAPPAEPPAEAVAVEKAKTDPPAG
jgi:serine/threonine protein phosphatase PrpC/CRP-like cAMP-binding protein